MCQRSKPKEIASRIAGIPPMVFAMMEDLGPIMTFASEGQTVWTAEPVFSHRYLDF